MLLRPILSRIHRNQRFANFCSIKNVGPSLLSPENACSPSSLKEKSLEKEYVISYLLNSCGLSPEKAVSASKKVHFDGPDKPNVVLSFLKKHGFSKTQIAELVSKHPPVLVCKPEKSLLPKIEFFLQCTGVSEKDVLTIVSRYPNFLTRSLEHRFAPVYDYLKDILGSGKVETLFRRGSWTFNFDLENRLIPNVDFLRELGVPQSCIALSLFHFPDIFWRKHVEFREIVEEVKQMGFDPLKSAFMLAIHARTGKGNLALWDQCYEVYSKWGWSKDDIFMAFRKHPSCMLLSEKKISTALDFLVNEVGRESRSVARCPYIIFYNMEKRIVPRCSIVRLLSLKGLVKKDWSLTSVLCPAEKAFLDKYVTRYTEKLPQLYDIYLSKKEEA
ncbi:hypothetical protein Pfo_006193 [Paulownia fortunei]|nr:hypothetical protein Pfo_006193 [Paulownia fortunei]